MSPTPKKSASSAVKSKQNRSRKSTGYEIDNRKLKKYRYEERVTPARLAFERYKFAQRELMKRKHRKLIRKYFGPLTSRSPLPLCRALRSSPLSLLLFYCQQNLLNTHSATNSNFIVPLYDCPVSLILFYCHLNLFYWEK